MTEEEKTKKPRAKKKKPTQDETRTPSDWCHALRRYNKGRSPGNKQIPHWQHTAADAMHGWAIHAHEANEPMQLTEDDYKAALAATEKTPLKAHAPACSPFKKV